MPPKQNVKMPPKKEVKIPIKNEIKVQSKKDITAQPKRDLKTPSKTDIMVSPSTLRKCDVLNVQSLELQLKQCRALVDEKNRIIEELKFKSDGLEEIKKAHTSHYTNQIGNLKEVVDELQKKHDCFKSREKELLKLLAKKEDIISSLKAERSTTSKTTSTAEASCQSEFIDFGFESCANNETKDKKNHILFKSKKIIVWASKSRECEDLLGLDGNNKLHDSAESTMTTKTDSEILRDSFCDLNGLTDLFETIKDDFVSTNVALLNSTQTEKLIELHENISQTLEKLKLVEMENNLQHLMPCENFSESELTNLCHQFPNLNEIYKKLDAISIHLKRSITSMENWSDSLNNKCNQLTEINKDLEKSMTDYPKHCIKLQYENDLLKFQIGKLIQTDCEITEDKIENTTNVLTDSKIKDINAIFAALRKLDSMIEVNAKLYQKLMCRVKQNQSLRDEVNQMKANSKQIESTRLSANNNETKNIEINSNLDYLKPVLNTNISEDMLLPEFEVCEELSKMQIPLDKVEDFSKQTDQVFTETPVNEELLLPQNELAVICDPLLLQCTMISENHDKSLIINDGLKNNLLQQIQKLELENFAIKLAKDKMERKYTATFESFKSLSAELEAELKSKLERENEKDELIALKEKCKEQEANILKLLATEENLKIEIKKLKSEIDAMQYKTEVNDNCVWQQQKLELVSETLKKDNKQKELLTSIEELSNAKKHSEMVIDEVNTENRVLKSLIEQLSTEKNINKIELQAMQNNVNYLDNEVSEKRNQLQTLFQEKQTVTDALERCETLCNSLKKEKCILEQKLEEAIVNKNNIQKKLESFKQVNTTKERFKLTIEKSSKSLKEENDEYKKELQTIKADYTNLKKEKKQLQEKYNANFSRMKIADAKVNEYYAKDAESEQKLKDQENEINTFEMWKAKSLEERVDLQKLLNYTRTVQFEKYCQFTEHLDNYNLLSEEKESIALQIKSFAFEIEDMNKVHVMIKETFQEFLVKWYAMERERNKHEINVNAAIQNKIEELNINNTEGINFLLLELNSLKETYEKAIIALLQEKLSNEQTNTVFSTKLKFTSSELKKFEDEFALKNAEHQDLRLKYKNVCRENYVLLEQKEDSQNLQQIVEKSIFNYSLLEAANNALFREKEECQAELDSCHKKLKSEKLLFIKEKKELRKNVRQLKSKCNNLFEISENLKAVNQSLQERYDNLQSENQRNCFAWSNAITKIEDGKNQNEQSHCEAGLKVIQATPAIQNSLFQNSVVAKQTSACSLKQFPKTIIELTQHSILGEFDKLEQQTSFMIKHTSKYREMKGSISGVSRHAADRKAKRQSFYEERRFMNDK